MYDALLLVSTRRDAIFYFILFYFLFFIFFLFFFLGVARRFRSMVISATILRCDVAIGVLS